MKPPKAESAGPAAPTEPFVRLREAATLAKRAMWLAAISKHKGNLTHVGDEFGFSQQRASAITKELALTEELAKIKAAAGQAPRGRPRLTKPKKRRS